MKSSKLKIFAFLSILALSAATARADEIVLKNGQKYSGKFVRGDEDVVEFRILGRIETFKILEVSQISFQQPELAVRTSPPTEVVSPKAEPDSSTAVQPSLPDAEKAEQVAAGSAASETPAPSVTLPEGTPLTIRTTTVIDTDRNRVGDVFDAVLEDPLTLGSTTIVPRGAPVKGVIAYAEESGKLTGKSTLILELTELTVNGKPYLLRTSDYSEVGASRGKQTATKAGGGAALGAIIGAIAGGGKGAAVGAAAGAAAGTGIQVLTKGETLKVPAETVLEFRLQHALTVEMR